MKKMWARVGMSFEISDAEYEKFIADCRGNSVQRMNANKTFLRWIQDGIGKPDGESYFPESSCFGVDDTDNVEELIFEV